MKKHSLRIWLATCFVLWTQAQAENALLAHTWLIQGTRRWTTAERKWIGSRPFICGLLALAIGCALWGRPPFHMGHSYPKCGWLFHTITAPRSTGSVSLRIVTCGGILFVGSQLWTKGPWKIMKVHDQYKAFSCWLHQILLLYDIMMCDFFSMMLQLSVAV